MRIIAGRFKGRKLNSPSGLSVRPTADRTRESVFNILSEKVKAPHVLDLFSGTGALGIEALSRGALRATFVDVSPQSIKTLASNLSMIGIADMCRVIRWDIGKNLNCLKLSDKFQLAFMDPPYEKGLISLALKNLHQSHCLANEALVVAEHSKKELITADPSVFALSDQRTYGKTLVSFLTYML